MRKTGWQDHAYVGMPNHFHLVVERPQPNLVGGMNWLLGEWGIPKDSPAGRQQLERALEARRGAEEGEEFKPVRRGWCLGQEAVRKELLAQLSQRLAGGGALRRGAGAKGAEGGLDCRAPLHGNARSSEPPAVFPTEVWRKVAIIKNRPLFRPFSEQTGRAVMAGELEEAFRGEGGVCNTVSLAQYPLMIQKESPHG